MTKDEALKMAIDCLECHQIDVLNACKEALEQPTWIGLADYEIEKIWLHHPKQSIAGVDWLISFARAIEQALKDKNA